MKKLELISTDWPIRDHKTLEGGPEVLGMERTAVQAPKALFSQIQNSSILGHANLLVSFQF